LASAQAYVDNPATQVDELGLFNCKAAREAAKEFLQMKKEVKAIRAREIAADPSARHFNVAAMRTKDGQTFYAMGATRDLNPALHPHLQGKIVTCEKLPSSAASKGMRLSYDSEKKLLSAVQRRGLEPAELYSKFPVCQRNIAPGISCHRALNNAGLQKVTANAYMSPERLAAYRSLFG
jgi:hypothetical protein